MKSKLLTALAFLLGSSALAANPDMVVEPFTNPVQTEERGVLPSRAANTFGLWVGALQPFPAIAGGGAALNIESIARVSLGLGYAFDEWYIAQLDAKYFTSLEEWSFFISAGIDQLNGVQGTKLISWELPFDRAFVPYLGGGWDYQSESGWMFNIAGNVMAPNGRLIILPSIALGFFF